MLKAIFIGLIFILSGCRTTHEIEVNMDTTTYFAISNTFDEAGWRNIILIEVDENELISAIAFDGFNASVSTTRQSLSSNQLDIDLFGYHFLSVVEQLREQLIGLTKEEMLERLFTLSNETDEQAFSITPFAYLATEALQSRPIVAGHYLSGLYQYVGLTDVQGISEFVNLFVFYGHIVAVHWNQMTEAGLLLYDPLLLIQQLDETTLRWLENATLAQNLLLDVQDPTTIVFDEEGNTFVRGTQIHIESFITLVMAALAEGPLQNE